MAITLRRMLKKTTSSLISVSNRTTGTDRAIFNTTISTTNLFRSTSVPTHHRFSALVEKRSDDTLLSLIESATDRAEKKFCKFAETLREFPFKIVGDSWFGMIKLTREYHGEEINVRVFTKDHQQSVSLLGEVSNKSGLTLKLDVEIYVADGIKINSLDIENQDASYEYAPVKEKPRFSELDEKVQKAFHKYMEVRGFEPRFTENFYQCMAEYKHEKYTALLKNLKNFISISNSNSTTDIFETTSVPTPHLFSAVAKKRPNADDTLLGVIETEIACAEEKFHKFTKAVPREFPFKILDDPEKEYITLTKDYQGEEIEVTVHGPRSNHADDEEEEEEDKDDQEADHQGDEEKEEKRDSQRVNLEVNVSKKSGLTSTFDVTADVEDGLITISGLNVKNPKASHDDDDDDDDDDYYKKHDFSELDENLQKTFHKYLEVRGFELSNTKFLCDYMVLKKRVKFTALLNKLKTFIAN